MSSTLYITPSYLTNYPSSVDWGIIPVVKSTNAQQVESQTEICQRATAFADSFIGQPMRATLNTHQGQTDDGRLTIDPTTGNGVFRTPYAPIISVVGVSVSPAQAFPPVFNALPSGSFRTQGVFTSPYPYPNGSGLEPRYIQIQPGYVTKYPPTLLQTAYVNGYPHAALTADATATDTTLQVDEVVGFAGASAYLYDGANTELVAVASVTADNATTGVGAHGPGTVTLEAGLALDHASGVLLSSFPTDFLEGCVMHGLSRVMMRGSTAVVMASLTGGATSSGANKAATYLAEAKQIFRRYQTQK